MLMVKLLVFTDRRGQSLAAMGEQRLVWSGSVFTPEEVSQAEISPVNISVRRLKGRLGGERERNKL